VIFSQKKYSGAVDIWSCGCILAELLNRKVLLPASSEQEMIYMINQLLGTPSSEIIDRVDDE
jgi:serine/threonine protein kinase